jgi:hypothetical protein
MSLSSSSSHATANKPATGKTAKATQCHGVCNKSKEADTKKAKSKHAADSSNASSSNSKPKAKAPSQSPCKLTDATAPAPATARIEQTPSSDQHNTVSAKTTKAADSARVADKAETPSTKPPHTHYDAHAAPGATTATDKSTSTADGLSQPKSSAGQLPSVPKRIGPVNLYIQHNLHKVELMLVTDEESWEAIVKPLNNPQKNELLANMVAFIISLYEVDVHIEDRNILPPTRMEIETLLDNMFAKTAQLA